jgi:hypothetical protein
MRDDGFYNRGKLAIVHLSFQDPTCISFRLLTLCGEGAAWSAGCDFTGCAGDPLRLRREGKLELTEALRSHDRS